MQGTAIIARGEAECDYLQLFHEANLFFAIFFRGSRRIDLPTNLCDQICNTGNIQLIFVPFVNV